MAGNEAIDGKRCPEHAGGAVNGGKKARTDGAGSPASAGVFVLSDMIAPSVAQYLGVRSLVRFGATCKAHGEVVVKEVARRKERVASIEAEVASLLGPQPETIPLRANVNAARELSTEALQLIDDEIDFHTKLSIREMSIERDPWERGYNWRYHDPFLEERKKFLCEACKPLGSLHVLPDVFWFPPEGESTSPSKEDIQKMSKTATKLWGAEGLMSGVYETNMDDPNWDRLDFEQPFRKFELRGAGGFREYMLETAYDVAGSDTELDAFRMGARTQVYNTPGARDCLWFTLEKADEIESPSDEDEGGNNSEEEGEVADAESYHRMAQMYNGMFGGDFDWFQEFPGWPDKCEICGAENGGCVEEND